MRSVTLDAPTEREGWSSPAHSAIVRVMFAWPWRHFLWVAVVSKKRKKESQRKGTATKMQT
jgi:hypothetical protein